MSPFPLPVLLVYVARRTLGPFLVLTAILLFALTLERVLSLVQVVTELGAPLYAVAQLVAYLLPHYLGMAIPAAWFLAVLIGIRGLLRDSELTVMRAAGLSLGRIISPLLIVSVVLVLVLLGITGTLQPYSRHAYRAKLQELRSHDFWSKLKPGVFTSIEGGENVVRVGTSTEGGRHFEDFFASYRPVGRGERVFVSAREARVVHPDTSSLDTDTQLELIDASMVVREDEDRTRAGAPRRLRSFTFDVFPWKLSESGLLPPYGPRGQDEREMTFGELRSGRAPAASVVVAAPRRLTEWHGRLVRCFAVPLFTILAVPLALLGRGRASHAYGFPIGIVLLVLFQKVLGTAEAYGKLGDLPAGPAVWSTCVALAVVAGAAFHWLGGDRPVKPAARPGVGPA